MITIEKLPNTFRKIVAKKLSPHFRDAVEIQDVAMPTIMKPTEILVKNCFLGINASDINYTAGKYRPDVKPPFDCGFEALGEIVKVGEKVKDFAVGNKVVTQSFGAFAEYQVVSSRLAKKVPSLDKRWLPLDLSGTTASISIEQIVKPLKGEVAIVTAAAGGTGQFAVQLLKRIYGCRVIGVTSSTQKEGFLRQLGCDDIINQEKETIENGIQRISPTGVNLAYESVGGETFEAIVNNIALRGRILSIGSISGYIDQSSWAETKSSHTPIQTRLLSKSATLHTFFLPHYAKYAQQHFLTLCELCNSGVIQSCIDSTHFKGLEALPDAVDYMYQRKNMGKVIVEV